MSRRRHLVAITTAGLLVCGAGSAAHATTAESTSAPALVDCEYGLDDGQFFLEILSDDVFHAALITADDIEELVIPVESSSNTVTFASNAPLDDLEVTLHRDETTTATCRLHERPTNNEPEPSEPPEPPSPSPSITPSPSPSIAPSPSPTPSPTPSLSPEASETPGATSTPEPSPEAPTSPRPTNTATTSPPAEPTAPASTPPGDNATSQPATPSPEGPYTPAPGPSGATTTSGPAETLPPPNDTPESGQDQPATSPAPTPTGPRVVRNYPLNPRYLLTELLGLNTQHGSGLVMPHPRGAHQPAPELETLPPISEDELDALKASLAAPHPDETDTSDQFSQSGLNAQLDADDTLWWIPASLAVLAAASAAAWWLLTRRQRKH